MFNTKFSEVLKGTLYEYKGKQYIYVHEHVGSAIIVVEQVGDFPKPLIMIPRKDARLVKKNE